MLADCGRKLERSKLCCGQKDFVARLSDAAVCGYGLGEMDADQLWETTLNPENRVLKRVEIEDARMASEITEMLMGSDVPPRRQFIYDHADEAEIDA